jgi:hypothetical protein
VKQFEVVCAIATNTMCLTDSDLITSTHSRRAIAILHIQSANFFLVAIATNHRYGDGIKLVFGFLASGQNVDYTTFECFTLII